MSDQTNRRVFLQRTAAVAAAMGVGGGSAIAAETKECPTHAKKGNAVLKLSCQDGRVPGDSLDAKLDLLEKWGFVGVEFGCARICPSGWTRSRRR